MKSAPTNSSNDVIIGAFALKKRPSPETFCVPRFKPLPFSMNKPPPTVFKQIPLQLTQPPLVIVLISAKPRPYLFRIGTINGPTTGILDAASEMILLPTTSPLPTPAAFAPLFNCDSISRL